MNNKNSAHTVPTLMIAKPAMFVMLEMTVAIF